jgi:hypothetical protein
MGYQRLRRWKLGCARSSSLAGYYGYRECNYLNWNWLLAGSVIAEHTNYCELGSIINMFVGCWLLIIIGRSVTLGDKQIE